MKILEQLKEDVINGYKVSKDEALDIYNAPLDKICNAANEIRKHFCGNTFDICTIINGKSGRCSEDCKYCAQSSFYNTKIETYSLLDSEDIINQAIYNENKGVLRYSIVTSGRKLDDAEVEKVCESVKDIKKRTKIQICGSFGLLKEKEFRKLKEAGVSRIHNNLETSRGNFPSVCTTHTYDDKIEAIHAAQKAGLSVCSGGIIGLGETISDRIDMAKTIEMLGINSVPVNILNPILGTPYENNKKLTNEDVCRTIAIFRFILPNASIRLAGGRGLLSDKGKACFLSGANAAISGDMLTTSGITIDEDMKMIKELGFKVGLWNE